MNDAKLIPLYIETRLQRRREWWHGVDTILAEKGMKIDPKHPDNADGHPIYLQAGDSHVCIRSGDWPSTEPFLYVMDEKYEWEARFNQRTPLSVVLEAIRHLEIFGATE
jgi:hypothetical protein